MADSVFQTIRQIIRLLEVLPQEDQSAVREFVNLYYTGHVTGAVAHTSSNLGHG